MSSLFLVIAAAVGAYLLVDARQSVHLSRKRLPDLAPLSDILESVSLCVEAGMDFTHAMAQVLERRRREEIAEELRGVLHGIRSGSTKAEAWRALATRVPHEDLRLLVSLILQAETLGTGLSSALRTFADGLREKRFREAEARALEAPVKLLLPMMCAFLAIFCLIGGALYLDLQHGAVTP